MKISKINTNKFHPAFTSIRTDRQTIKQLKDGEKPLLENNKQNIYAALNNLSSLPDRNNIEFLLDVSSNLAYGQGRNDSEFKQILDNDGITPSERENTNWSQILDDTIKKALDAASTNDDYCELQAEYENASNNKKLSPKQQKILELRENLTNIIINESTLQDSETLARTARVRKNLDYFTASSEIPLKQKEECLEKFIYFLSDDYKITPQLKDKKLQAVDEMLNDLLIKTPDDDILKTKAINQRSSGMCAAISFAREMLAYEDKTRFVELIMDELEDSPFMPVFDITELSSGKKVNIPKTNIDYNTALEKGYRIIDASVHNWMHNAHSLGDGTIQKEYYVPFDKDNYGIYDDSSWYLGLDEDKAPYKILLQALIKEKRFLKSYNSAKTEILDTHNNVNSIKKEVYETQKSALGKLNTIFAEIFPQKTNSEISALEKGIIDFCTGTSEENEVYLPDKLPNELKQNILADFITANTADITEEQKSKIKDNISSIYLMADEYIYADKQLKTLQKFNSPRNKYILNKRLYNLAAAHRLAIEADINMPDGVIRFEQNSGLPPRDIQIADYMKSIKSGFSSAELRKKYTDGQGKIPSQKELENELNSDLLKIESIIPSELNLILKNLTDHSEEEIAAAMFNNIAERIKNQEPDILDNTKMIMGIDGDKNKVISFLHNWADKLSNSHSQKDILYAVRLLGYEDNLQFCNYMIANFFNFMEQGISEEEYNRLSEKFGGSDKINSGLQSEIDKFGKISNEYNSIIDKWQVPSARSNILSQLEKSNCVLSRKKLDILKNKFNSISSGLFLNEKIQNMKERKKADDRLYKFSNSENQIFQDIEKTLPFTKRYNKVTYQTVNDFLSSDLEKQYSDIGMLNGQFWVAEDGSSGLNSTEQLRIIEQMTGKPYHIETSVSDAVKQIKQGEGSGVISMSVDDKDYAFHAQYVPFVSSETFVNPLTNEKTIKDIIWTDNSWGRAEKEHFWNGNNGFKYTDYAGGYGWKDGFILADNYLTGLPAEDISNARGVAEKDNDEFRLFSDFILPGAKKNTYTKLYEMFEYIINMDEPEKLYSKLEDQIKNGSRFSIKEIEGIDDSIELRTENISKRIDNEIKSKEDYDKLPENDEVKFIFNKIAAYFSTENPLLAEQVLAVNNDEELQSVIKEIEDEHVVQMAAITGKSDVTLENLYTYSIQEFDVLFDTLKKDYKCSIPDNKKVKILNDIFFDEKALQTHDGTLKGLENFLKKQTVKSANTYITNKEACKYFIKEAKNILSNQIDTKIRIKSLDSPNLVNSPLSEYFIGAIDKYFNPASDEELLSIIQDFQEADNDTVDEFFDILQDKDLGINSKDPYSYFELYKAGDSSVQKAFSDVILNQEINLFLNTNKNYKTKSYSTPEEIYRYLYINLSDMNVQKYINEFKDEAFKKYQVRQAFPQPVVISDDLLKQSIDEILELTEQFSDSILSRDLSLNIFSKYTKLKSDFENEPFYQDLLNNCNVEITDDNKAKIIEFKSAVEDLYNCVQNDDSLKDLTEELELLISSISLSEFKIDGETAGGKLKNILKIFDNLDKSGINKDRFIQLKKEEIKSMNNSVQMIAFNIEPKYRNDFIKQIYEYISLYRNNSDEDTLNQRAEDIIELFINKHITKNPPVLLKECVKSLLNNKESSDEYKILRQYLQNALKISQQTRIQYKLVKNQHEGISSKTKDLLSLFNVYLTDGSQESMDSENGMLYLIEQLANSDNYDYTNLNLFLNQSGLSKRAVSSLINTFYLDKTTEIFDEETEKIKTNIKDLNTLIELVETYKNINRINYKSLKESVGGMKNFIKQKLQNNKNSTVFDLYIKYLNSLKYQSDLNPYSPEIINDLTYSIGINGFSYINEVLNNQTNYLGDLSQMIEKRVRMIDSIQIPVDSEEYKLKCSFLKDYENLQSHIEDKNNEIMETINNCNNLNGLISETAG